MDFDLDKFRTTQQRVEMVLHDDCPYKHLEIVVEADKDDDVIIACAFNKKADDELDNKISDRLKITHSDLVARRLTFKIVNDKKHKDAFCTLPWIHAATNSNGSIRVCCQMIYNDKQIPFGNIYKEDGTPLKGSDDIDIHRNAKNWKLLRKDMLNGKRHNACKLCWDEEDNNLESKRQQHNIVNQSLIEDMLNKTKPDGTIEPDDFPIHYWDLRFGNKCNIKCRTCGPTDSDQWYSDWKVLGQGDTFNTKDGDTVTIEEIGPNQFKTPDIFKWVDDSKLWDNIKTNIKKVNRFYFTGGEPTVNIKHRELLDFMIEQGVAKDIILEYNTNMVGIPDSVYAQWSKFKEVHLGMSIDGIYEHFEYIRHPGKWPKVDKGIKKVDTDERLKNTTATYTVTLSIMNIVHILDMIWWHKEQKYDRVNPNIIIHNLYAPKFYNTVNLPEPIKVIINRLYVDFINDIYKRWPNDIAWCNRTEETLNSITKHMNSAEADPAELPKYIQRQKALDTARGEDWNESLKGISELLTYYRESQIRKSSVKLAKTTKRK
jgi:MoaA/NifB/PqqE/SkfB family radical SAM enzyme